MLAITDDLNLAFELFELKPKEAMAAIMDLRTFNYY
jgi:hypothetical protein